jgi:hypothetical protein
MNDLSRSEQLTLAAAQDGALRIALNEAASALFDVANGGLWGQTNEDAWEKIREHCRKAARAARKAALEGRP